VFTKVSFWRKELDLEKTSSLVSIRGVNDYDRANFHILEFISIAFGLKTKIIYDDYYPTHFPLIQVIEHFTHPNTFFYVFISSRIQWTGTDRWRKRCPKPARKQEFSVSNFL